MLNLHNGFYTYRFLLIYPTSGDSSLVIFCLFGCGENKWRKLPTIQIWTRDHFLHIQMPCGENGNGKKGSPIQICIVERFILHPFSANRLPPQKKFEKRGLYRVFFFLIFPFSTVWPLSLSKFIVLFLLLHKSKV